MRVVAVHRIHSANPRTTDGCERAQRFVHLGNWNRFGHIHRVAGHPPVGHPVGAQRIELGQSELKGMEAENIGHRAIELNLLPCHEVLAGRGSQPLIKLYNRLRRAS